MESFLLASQFNFQDQMRKSLEALVGDNIISLLLLLRRRSAEKHKIYLHKSNRQINSIEQIKIDMEGEMDFFSLTTY